MRIYYKYLLILACTLIGTSSLLIVLGYDQLDLYLTLYVIEYLTLTLLFSHFSKPTKRILHSIGFSLIPIVVLVIIIKAMSILSALGLR